MFFKNCFKIHALHLLISIVILTKFTNCLENGNVGDLWKEHDGNGDIAELWPKDEKGGDSKAAAYGLKSTSSRKWQLKDGKGNTIIPYAIDEDSFDDKHIAEIEKAIHTINTNTCVKFLDKSDEKYTNIRNKPNDDYVKITSAEPQGGCFANGVGWVKGVQNLINLARPSRSGGGCIYYGVIIHELMHKIGFWHEQMRPDRDDYIEIMEDNVKTGKMSQFDKVGERSGASEKSNARDREHGHAYSKYEYMSIMHYRTNSFARDPSKPTMRVKDPNVDEKEIGQRTEMTKNDYYAVCEMYNCKQCIGKPFPPEEE